MDASANCRFEKCYSRGGSVFLYHLCTHCKEIDDPVIYVEFVKGEVSLSSLIHEINECELVNLLIKKFEQPPQQTIKFDKHLRKKYKHFMDMQRHGPIKASLVSHIMSPYGCCGSPYTSIERRIFW